jgi:hypothetical protein
MTTRYEDDRRVMRDVLQAAGWVLTTNGQLGDADLAYDNGNVVLELAQTGKKENQRFILAIVRPDGAEMSVVVDYGDELDQTLKYLVSSQDTITPENAREKLLDLYLHCKDFFVDIDDEVVPLSQAWEQIFGDVRNYLRATLTKAGWTRVGSETGPLKMEYRSGAVPLRLSEAAPNSEGELDALFLVIAGSQGFAIYFGERLADVLSTIIDAQHQLTAENYTELVEKLLAIAPRMFALIDGELRPIVG